MHQAGGKHAELRLARRLVAGMVRDDADDSAARQALGILIDLYRRRIFTDEPTVNCIGDACLSK